LMNANSMNLSRNRNSTCVVVPEPLGPAMRTTCGDVSFIQVQIPFFRSQTLQRLAESKLHNIPIRIAHHRKVPDDSAYIHRRLNQNILLTCQLSNPIDFFATVALKSEVI